MVEKPFLNKALGSLCIFLPTWAITLGSVAGLNILGIISLPSSTAKPELTWVFLLPLAPLRAPVLGFVNGGNIFFNKSSVVKFLSV